MGNSSLAAKSENRAIDKEKNLTAMIVLTAGITLRVGKKNVIGFGGFFDRNTPHIHVEQGLLLKIEPYLAYELQVSDSYSIPPADRARVKVAIFCSCSPCKNCVGELVKFADKWKGEFKDRPFRVKYVFQRYWSWDDAGKNSNYAWSSSQMAEAHYREAKTRSGFGVEKAGIDFDVLQKFKNKSDSSSAAVESITSIKSVLARGASSVGSIYSSLSTNSSGSAAAASSSSSIAAQPMEEFKEDQEQAIPISADQEAATTWANFVAEAGPDDQIGATSRFRHKRYYHLVIKQAQTDSESISTFSDD
jgi:hypothetical protein